MFFGPQQLSPGDTKITALNIAGMLKDAYRVKKYDGYTHMLFIEKGAHGHPHVLYLRRFNTLHVVIGRHGYNRSMKRVQHACLQSSRNHV